MPRPAAAATLGRKPDGRFRQEAEKSMQASTLMAAARRVRLDGSLSTGDSLPGGYRAAYRGLGLEYEESREYLPGDDVAAMDWKVTARLGRPFVKRFREERSRTVMLAVDVSASMAAGAGSDAVAYTAALAAVVLAKSAAASRDRVGLVLFSDRVEAFLPPGKGAGQEAAVAHLLAETVPTGRATDPGPALALIAATLTHRCPIFFLSDFCGAAFATPLGRLAARHEVTAAVVGPEVWLPPPGLTTVVEAETGRRALCDGASQPVRARLAAAGREARARTVASLRQVGADVVFLDTAVHPAVALEAFFHRRSRCGSFAVRPGRRAHSHG